MKTENKMEDSGKREEFESGAVRDAAEGKSRPDLVSPYAEERIGQWMAKGAEKYDERNWEKGMSISRCVASISRHLIAFKMGLQNEDHLAAIAVNAQFIMHYEAMIGMGKLPITLDDMPDYEDDYNAAEIDGPLKFEPGDIVSIEPYSGAGDLIRKLCQEAGYRGTYIKTDGSGHLVKIGRVDRWFFNDEIFPVEDN